MRGVAVALICVVLLIGCGGGSGEEAWQPNWCYVKSADWLLNGDPEFALYAEVKNQWPPEGLIEDVFNTYNQDEELYLSCFSALEWTEQDAVQWFEKGYRVVIIYPSYTLADGTIKYHSEPMADTALLAGKVDTQACVAWW